MNVGFFLAGESLELYSHAENLVRSVRQHCPGTPIVHLTDKISSPVDGVDAVHRLDEDVRPLKPKPIIHMRIMSYAACSGEWLFLDTDTVIRKPVADVFDDPLFDVAVTDRNWGGIPQGDAIMHEMPFNTGVVFSRSQEFWESVLTTWRSLEDKWRDWFSEQRCVYTVVRSGLFKVRILEGDVYNSPPRDMTDRGSDLTAIQHFKGPRKEWLTMQISQRQ